MLEQQSVTFGNLERGAQLGNVSVEGDLNITIGDPETRVKIEPKYIPHLSQHFVGRSDVLGQIKDIFQQRGLGQCIIHGMAGRGKTRLALEFANRYTDDYKNFLWISAASVVQLNDNLTRLLARLGFRDPEDHGMRRMMLQNWMTNNDDWLLLVDDARHGVVEQVLSLVPQGSQTGKVLITTRSLEVSRRAIDDSTSHHGMIELKALDQNQAIDLFNAIVGPSMAQDWGSCKTERMALEALVQKLGGSPLLIKSASSWCKHREYLSPSKIVAEYDRVGRSTIWNRPLKFEEDRSLTRSSMEEEELLSANTIFEVMLKDLRMRHPMSWNLLNIMAYMDTSNLQTILLQAGFESYEEWQVTRSTHIFWPLHKLRIRYRWQGKDQEIRTLGTCMEVHEAKLKNTILQLQREFSSSIKFHETIEVLRQWSLLSASDASTSCFIMHDELADFLRHRITSTGAQDEEAVPHKWYKIALFIVASMCNSPLELSHDGPQGMTGVLASYIRELSNQSVRTELRSVRLLIAQGFISRYLRAVGRFEEARDFSKCQFEDARQILGARHMETIHARYDLAWSDRMLGSNDEAEREFNRLIRMLYVRVGPGNPSSLRAKKNLAEIYLERGQHDEAEKLLWEVISGWAQSDTPSRIDLFRAIGTLASLRYEQGQYSEAESLQYSVYDYLLEFLGQYDVRTIESMDELACITYAQGKYDLAEDIMSRVLRLRQRKLGEYHPHTISTEEQLRDWQERAQASNHEEAELLQTNDDSRTDDVESGPPQYHPWQSLTYTSNSNLPYNWSQQFNPQGCPYYVDHNHKVTSWVDPTIYRSLRNMGPPESSESTGSERTPSTAEAFSLTTESASH